MKLKTLFAGASLMLASFSASAINGYPVICDFDCTSSIETTSVTYQLSGSATIYDINGKQGMLPTLSAAGTLTYSTWYNLDTGEGGEDALIEIAGLFLGTQQVISSYTWATGSTGLVTDYVYEEFGLVDTAETLLFNGSMPSEWNYLVGSFEPVSVYTLDNNLDQIAGVNAYILGGQQVTIDYQLSQVPVPAAVWLFGSGLVMLAGFMRRRNI